MTTKRGRPSSASKIASLEAQVAELMKLVQAGVTPSSTVEVSADYEDEKLSPDEYISVMSLLPYTLNLSTRVGGQGAVKKFTKFGEVKRILYRELVEIVENHRNFMEAGYFYILNPVFIRHHGLDDIYSKILTKERIEEILTANTEETVSFYKSANPKQQEVVVQLLVERAVENPDSVDFNMIDKLARISKIDINQIIKDRLEAGKENQTENEE